MASAEPEKIAEEEPQGGELVYCGATQLGSTGKTMPSGFFSGNLVSPTRLRPLVGVDIKFVASGCAASHCVALDVEGRCYTWGRNDKGQLGHGDTILRHLPTIVSSLSKYKIIKASVGRNHTVIVTDGGKSFAFGHNKHGQLGTGSSKNEIETSPVQCLVSEATNAVCGADFTMWLSNIQGSSILSAGHPQYGQLGHGTDNEYNMKDASVKLAYEAQSKPKPIIAFSEKKIVKVACGINHTVAVDSNGFVYTWGNGGYGRLGHREQKDEWVPRLVEVFQKHNVLPPNAVISAGASSCACTAVGGFVLVENAIISAGACAAGGGQMYMWGKLKNTGDDWMYPKPLMDLSGWNIRCMASGNMHHMVGADESCISWGQALYGELGYGPLGQKSSANPKKVELLEGMHVLSVGCGFGMSLIVIDRAKAGDRLDQLDVYDGSPDPTEEEKEVKKTPASKKKAAPKKTQKKNKSESSEEDENNSEEDEEDSEEEAANGKATSGRKRGRPAKKGKLTEVKPSAKKGKLTEVKPEGRGRGRPKKSDASTSAAKKGKSRK